MTCEDELIVSPDTFIAEMNHRRNSVKQLRITAVTGDELRKSKNKKKKRRKDSDQSSSLTGENVSLSVLNETYKSNVFPYMFDFSLWINRKSGKRSQQKESLLSLSIFLKDMLNKGLQTEQKDHRDHTTRKNYCNVTIMTVQPADVKISLDAEVWN